MVVEVAMQSAHTRVVAIKPAIPIIGSPTKQPWRKFAEAFFCSPSRQTLGSGSGKPEFCRAQLRLPFGLIQFGMFPDDDRK